ncbi:MAG: hypothetical protein IKT56_04605 [Clostridia bacterium]|nr:hypothetical protein [Clostridia bacterium]
MTDLKFAILHFLYHSPNHENEIVALYNQRLGPVGDVRIALDDMMKNNETPFIIRPVGKTTFKLTSHGNIAYETAQEERRKQAKDKKQQSFNNKISVAAVLVPLITFILGLFVESQVNIVDWLLSFFK